MYVCDWCDANIIRKETMVCLSRHFIVRKPKRLAIESAEFSTDQSELTFHEYCFCRNVDTIMRVLYRDIDPEQPRQRALDPEFPLLDI